MEINADFAYGDEHKLATHIAAQDQDVLVVWHHGEIPQAISSFTIENETDTLSEWPEVGFNLIWVLTKVAGAQTQRFSSLNQQLLAGDLASETDRFLS